MIHSVAHKETCNCDANCKLYLHSKDRRRTCRSSCWHGLQPPMRSIVCSIGLRIQNVSNKLSTMNNMRRINQSISRWFSLCTKTAYPVPQQRLQRLDAQLNLAFGSSVGDENSFLLVIDCSQRRASIDAMQFVANHGHVSFQPKFINWSQ